MIVKIYECNDRTAFDSDIELNESKTKEFWAVAELVEHDAQKHPGDGWRMWEACIEIEDLGLCLVTVSYERPTLWAARHWETGSWLGFQENSGFEWTRDFLDPNWEWADRETQTLTCLWALENPKHQIETALYNLGDESIKFEDLVLVKV